MPAPGVEGMPSLEEILLELAQHVKDRDHLKAIFATTLLTSALLVSFTQVLTEEASPIIKLNPGAN